jgi:hypothetical protein
LIGVAEGSDFLIVGVNVGFDTGLDTGFGVVGLAVELLELLLEPVLDFPYYELLELDTLLEALPELELDSLLYDEPDCPLELESPPIVTLPSLFWLLL